MKRRSKTKYTQIHVSIPVRTLEDFDDTLDFKQSRSKIISNLIKSYLQGEASLDDYSRLEIIEHLQYQYDKDSPEDVLIQALLALH
jgi:metal-responsive CopG/Arc/MetJ family transcriptional regulator